MPNRFMEIAFTPSVQAEQGRHGSRTGYAAWAARKGQQPDDGMLGEEEISFIAARDGFYIATVSETGWPYVQYRGGPTGFVRVIGDGELVWADFRGNRQYISMGNVAGDDRVSLFFMDYAHQRRLKLLGRMTAKEVRGPSDLDHGLTLPDYAARIEHEVRVRIEGFDWNCPQHITQRFTSAEVEAAVTPLREHVRRLERRLAEAGMHLEPSLAQEHDQVRERAR